MIGLLTLDRHIICILMAFKDTFLIVVVYRSSMEKRKAKLIEFMF